MNGITRINDVDIARDIKSFVSKVDVEYSDDSLKPKIMDANDDDFLFVAKEIGSKTKITSVRLVDDAFLDEFIEAL